MGWTWIYLFIVVGRLLQNTLLASKISFTLVSMFFISPVAIVPLSPPTSEGVKNRSWP